MRTDENQDQRLHRCAGQAVRGRFLVTDARKAGARFAPFAELPVAGASQRVWSSRAALLQHCLATEPRESFTPREA